MNQSEIDRINQRHRNADLVVRGAEGNWDDELQDSDETHWIFAVLAGGMVLAVAAIVVGLLAVGNDNEDSTRRS